MRPVAPADGERDWRTLDRPKRTSAPFELALISLENQANRPKRTLRRLHRPGFLTTRPERIQSAEWSKGKNGAPDPSAPTRSGTGNGSVAARPEMLAPGLRASVRRHRKRSRRP